MASFCAVDLEAQRGDRLVEQAVPGAVGGDRFFVEQLLEPVVELVGLALADIEDPGPVMRQRTGSQRVAERVVVKSVQLQFEEQQIGGRGGQLFLCVAIEFAARGIGRVAGIDETGVGTDAPEQFVERLVATHRPGEGRAGLVFGERRDLAAIGVGESRALGGGAVEVGGEGGIVRGGVEVGEVPFRKGRLRRRRALRGFGGGI